MTPRLLRAMDSIEELKRAIAIAKAEEKSQAYSNLYPQNKPIIAIRASRQ